MIKNIAYIFYNLNEIHQISYEMERGYTKTINAQFTYTGDKL